MQGMYLHYLYLGFTTKKRLLVGIFALAYLLSSLGFSPLVQAKSIPRFTPFATNRLTSIVAVHGLNAGDGSSGTADPNDNSMPGCASYWSDAKAFLQSRWPGDFRQLAYYGDEHDDNGSPCWSNGNERTYSANLRDNIYASHCSQFFPGSEGTNNEDLDHIACELDWYLYYNFNRPDWGEILVGHSMGGVIIRKALQLVQSHNPFVPSNIGHVTDAITLNAPLNGANLASWGCGDCWQGQQMEPNSPFILSLANDTHIDVGGHTDWTTVSSGCFQNTYDDPGGDLLPVFGDKLVNQDSAVAYNEDHKVVFYATVSVQHIFNIAGCDSHGGIIHNTDSELDTAAYYCDNPDLSNPANCGTDQLENKRWTYLFGYGDWQDSPSRPGGLNELYYALSSYAW